MKHTGLLRKVGRTVADRSANNDKVHAPSYGLVEDPMVSPMKAEDTRICPGCGRRFFRCPEILFLFTVCMWLSVGMSNPVRPFLKTIVELISQAAVYSL